MKPIPDLEDFCEVMLEKTNGLVITFNHRTNPTLVEMKDERLASEMLGLRVAFETKLVEGCRYDDFESFSRSLQKSLGSTPPTLELALDGVFRKFGEDKHIILGVDEMLLGAGVRDHKQYLNHDRNRLFQILAALGVELDNRSNLHLVLTSLSYSYFMNEETNGGRLLHAVKLRNLTFDESMAMAQCFHKTRQLEDEDAWINDAHAKQIVEDCAGVPRLLEEVFDCLSPGESLQDLRGNCKQIKPLSKLSSDVTLWCPCENPRIGRNHPASELWQCIKRILRFDSDEDGNRFNGQSFETFFHNLWRLRCLTRRYQVFQVEGKGATATIGEKQFSTMREMLTSFENTPDISTPEDGSISAFEPKFEIESPKEYRFGGNGPPWDRVTHAEVYSGTGHPRILTTGNTTEPGLDSIMTFPLPLQLEEAKEMADKVAVFSFQK